MTYIFLTICVKSMCLFFLMDWWPQMFVSNLKFTQQLTSSSLKLWPPKWRALCLISKMQIQISKYQSLKGSSNDVIYPTIVPIFVWVEEWVQELALQRQISKMVQEKTQYVQELFKEQVKLQLLDTQMDDIQSKLAAVCICFLLMIQHQMQHKTFKHQN